MSRLIDADELKLELKWLEDDTPVYHDVMSTIEDAPTVDPIKHGYMVKNGGWYWCTLCGDHWAEDGANYCPNCGAVMDEVEEDG